MFVFFLMSQVGYVCLLLDASGRLCLFVFLLMPQVGYVCFLLDDSGRLCLPSS